MTQLLSTVAGSAISGATGPTGATGVTGSTGPTGSMMKNRIINGAMVLNQRGGNPYTVSAGDYTLDRYQAQSQPSASVFSVAQSSTAPTGFNNSMLVTSLANTSLGATAYYYITQKIEGYNVADLGFGTANAKTVTLSFWVQSSLTGTFGGAISNSAEDRNYPFSYSIPVANTWTQISVTIAGDTTGTWLKTNGIGLSVRFGLGVGTTYSATAGSWTSSAYVASATGAVSVVGTSGATFYITGVQLEVGSSATGFEYRMYGAELANCYRYYETSYVPTTAIGSNVIPQAVNAGYATSTSLVDYCTSLPFKVNKRASPTMSYYKDDGTANVWTAVTIGNITPNNQWVGTVSFAPYYTAGAIFTTNRFYSAEGNWAASAEL